MKGSSDKEYATILIQGAVLFFGAATLAGCGGGGGGLSLQEPQSETIVTLASPAVSVKVQMDRYDAEVIKPNDPVNPVAGEYDTLYSADRYTDKARTTVSCGTLQSTQCEEATTPTAYFSIAEAANLKARPEDEITNQVIGSLHGVTLLERLWRHPTSTDENFSRYGSWMVYSSFNVGRFQPQTGNVDVSATAMGMIAPPPTDSAVYRGLMVGRQIGNTESSDMLQGDVELEYKAETGVMDVGITRITNVGEGNERTPHRTPSLEFVGVSIDPSGEFSDGKKSDGARGPWIRGLFAGSGASEAVAVFEHSGIVGSFGAKRQ